MNFIVICNFICLPQLWCDVVVQLNAIANKPPPPSSLLKKKKKWKIPYVDKWKFRPQFGRHFPPAIQMRQCSTFSSPFATHRARWNRVVSVVRLRAKEQHIHTGREDGQQENTTADDSGWAWLRPSTILAEEADVLDVHLAHCLCHFNSCWLLHSLPEREANKQITVSTIVFNITLTCIPEYVVHSLRIVSLYRLFMVPIYLHKRFNQSAGHQDHTHFHFLKCWPVWWFVLIIALFCCSTSFLCCLDNQANRTLWELFSWRFWMKHHNNEWHEIVQILTARCIVQKCGGGRNRFTYFGWTIPITSRRLQPNSTIRGRIIAASFFDPVIQYDWRPPGEAERYFEEGERHLHLFSSLKG